MVIDYLSVETVFNWTFLRDPWTLDKTFVGHMVDGSDSWIKSGFLRRLMAITGCSCAAAFFVVKNLLQVDLFSSAAATVGLISQIIVPAAAAVAAAIVVAHALSSLDESAVCANVDEISVFVVQAAVAAAAALVVTFAHSPQVESAAGANVDELVIFVVKAAPAWVAATVAVHLLFETSWVVFL